jgi:Fic family protein
MGQNNKEKILNVYFENTGKSFTVRELSNLTKIPRATMQNKLVELKKQKLIDKNNLVLENELF